VGADAVEEDIGVTPIGRGQGLTTR
jgi:hypothetical protein